MKRKSGRTYYTEEKVKNARENIKKYAWAREEMESVVKTAERYVGLEDKLWEMVPGEGLPRSWIVGHKNDPKSYTCPHPDCGVDLRAEYSTYPWITDPINEPWKITCPACGRKFPSNDFEAYYKSGLDERGVFNPDLADRTLLINELYPELGEGWGVDDGFGYYTGTTYPDGVRECKTFIAHYIALGLWVKWTSDNGEIAKALESLSMAYLFTGDIKYGRAGAILLSRVADLYPDFKLIQFGTNWWNSHGGYAEGKITGRIEDCKTANFLIRAYDALYPAMEDEHVIDFLSEKAKKYKLKSKMADAGSIRKNCEDGILREVFKACKSADIYGNFGMHQSTLALAAVVLDSEPETPQWIEWLMQAGDYTPAVIDPKTKLATVLGSVSGGNVLNRIVDDYLRDGEFTEASPQYDRASLAHFSDFLEALDGYEGMDLLSHPMVQKMYTSFAPLTLVSKATAQIGDSGRCVWNKICIDEKGMQRAFKKCGDIKMAQYLYMWYKAEGKDIGKIHSDIFTKDPEKIKQDILESVAEHGALSFESEMMNGFGFSILRDGAAPKKENEIDTQRDFWLYYGTTTGISSHGHAGMLNLGIEAYGLNMAPELGYPEETGASAHRNQWTRITLSHNTVTVDEKEQPRNATGSTGAPLHFDDAGKIKLMDIDAPGAYAGTCDTYRRTVVMIAVNDEVSYGVDFFRVRGGDDHIYSFHSQSDTVYEACGLNLSEQKNNDGEWIGSYAGADVPWGADLNDPNDSNAPFARRGYTWLEKIRKYTAPSGKFNVDYKITDFRNTLPYDIDLHLNVTVLNDDLDEVTLAQGTPPRVFNNPEKLEYLLARRSGKNLDTLFNVVYEPYKDEKYIQNVAASAQVNTAEVPRIEPIRGRERETDIARVVRVELKGGRVDYIVYATNNTVEYAIYQDGKATSPMFTFRGFLGVYTLESGKRALAYVNDGDVIDDVVTRSAYMGEVVDFTRKLSMENYITVRFDKAVTLDTASLAGRHIYIGNDGFENGVYLIKGTNVCGENVRLDIGDVPLVRRYKVREDMDAGFVYNIAEGQKFRIPLSFIQKNNRTAIAEPI